MIGIVLDRESIPAGEFLTGRVEWIGEPGRAAAMILVALEWQTEGPGNTERGYPRALPIKVRKGQHEGTFPFRLLIPYEGPVSFQGDLFAVQWKLRARVDQNGLDEFIAADFSVCCRR